MSWNTHNNYTHISSMPNVCQAQYLAIYVQLVAQWSFKIDNNITMCRWENWVSRDYVIYLRPQG